MVICDLLKYAGPISVSLLMKYIALAFVLLKLRELQEEFFTSMWESNLYLLSTVQVQPS